MAYKTIYDTSGNYPNSSDDKSHIECKPYQISWCGDGVIDTTIDTSTGKSFESCDDGADNGKSGKCKVSCDGINTIPPDVCDQTFPSVALRYGYDYNFFDKYSNLSPVRQRLQGFEVEFIEPYDYNASPSVPTFSWTPELVAKNYIMSVGETNFKALSSTPYFIKATPPQRLPNNFQINYRIRYSKEISPGVWDNQKVHKECQPYAISWCGDGIVDIAPAGAKWESEPCDPAAEPWKTNGGCRVDPTDGKKCQLTPKESFDLSIKKYVDDTSKDAQTAQTAIEKSSNSVLNYKIIVKNEGPASTSSMTTVKDTLPAGVEIASQNAPYAT